MKQFRILITPAIEVDATECLQLWYGIKEEVLAAVNATSLLLLFLQDDLAVMEDYSNSICAEQCVNGEWLELMEIDK